MNTTKEIEKIKEIIYKYGQSIDYHGVDDGDIDTAIKDLAPILEQSKREAEFTLEELIEIKYWLFTVPHSQHKDTMTKQFEEKLDKLISEKKEGNENN